jgi:hypothetical protein
MAFNPWPTQLHPAPGVNQPGLGRLKLTGLASTEMVFFTRKYPIFDLIISFPVLIRLWDKMSRSPRSLWVSTKSSINSGLCSSNFVSQPQNPSAWRSLPRGLDSSPSEAIRPRRRLRGSRRGSRATSWSRRSLAKVMRRRQSLETSSRRR